MRKYAIILLLFVICLPLAAQKRIKYKAEGKQQVVRKQGKSIRYLVEDVVFTQETTTVYCDSAVYIRSENKMEAFDNVKIVDDSTTITARKLNYNGNNRKTELRGNVIYKRGYQELYTDNLDYNLQTEVARYFDGGKLIDTTNVLSSTLGYFYAKQNIAYFYSGVILESPDFTLKTDTLKYNTITKVAYTTGHTEITNKDGTQIYSKGGEFQTEISQTEFVKGNIETEEYILDGDKIFFDDLNKYYRSEGKVKLTAKEQNVILIGDEGYYDRVNGYSKIYGNPIMKKVMEADTFYIAADTMIAIESQYDTARRILAYPDIRIYRQNLQGIADSAAYFISDSIITMYRTPYLWTGQNQISADTIVMQLSETTIEQMDLKRNAFMITIDTLGNHNQIKGRQMNVYFADNKISYIDIFGNCESIFHSLDEFENILLGVNRLVTSNMTIRFRENQIENFTIYKNPEGKFIPPHELTEADKRLKGFNWLGDRRTTLQDIYVKPEPIEAGTGASPAGTAPKGGKPTVRGDKKPVQRGAAPKKSRGGK